ncbi:hypothetical protein CEUSTIGMA_g13245.t1 [Chlamydomonas eustigma]|uniref:Uncharacterized protein n=1 Tax=Chlamydomonas eustigma TaxID=1157962 RepID=A0A250XSP7_9CHLO|nr:hypothetical protein CEUSTIGMA_g13245.t1 [Chlamydomonas eustigma]|eukprot:GAX85830.1 hypothetical protein CEUSTIGMA_g13245.t1 [Chlamydomonas eustigma]
MTSSGLKEAVKILTFTLHFLCLLIPLCSQDNGFKVEQIDKHATSTASIDGISVFRNVECSNTISAQNVINYCVDASCGVCSQIQTDPCQVLDSYAENTSTCMLPVFLGGTLQESTLCGTGTTIHVVAPDNETESIAASVTVFRDTTGFLYITVVMTCDWLLVVDIDQGFGVYGSVAYSNTVLQFSNNMGGTPYRNNTVTQRFLCLTAPIQLQQLSSLCQNLDTIVNMSMSIQRFTATDPETCAESSPVYNISAYIDMGLIQTPQSYLVSTSNVANNEGLNLPPSPSPLITSSTAPAMPAVLAVLQLQLNLSGAAANAWMNTLSGSGTTSDVQTLGHDVGILVALPHSTSMSKATAEVAAVGLAVSSEGGAVRSWALLSGPQYGGVDYSKLPNCTSSSVSSTTSSMEASASNPQLLALALRLPPSSSTNWILATVSAALPSSLCMSSEDQLDVRTDVQVRVLGPVPATPQSVTTLNPTREEVAAAMETSTSSGSGSSNNILQALLASAAFTQPMLLPPLAAPVPLTVTSSGVNTYDVLTAAGLPTGQTTRPPYPTPIDMPPSVQPPASSGLSSESTNPSSSRESGNLSSVTVALASILGVVVLALVLVLMIFFVRRSKSTSISCEVTPLPSHSIPAERSSSNCSLQFQNLASVNSMNMKAAQVWSTNITFDAVDVNEFQRRSTSEGPLCMGMNLSAASAGRTGHKSRTSNSSLLADGIGASTSAHNKTASLPSPLPFSLSAFPMPVPPSFQHSDAPKHFSRSHAGIEEGIARPSVGMPETWLQGSWRLHAQPPTSDNATDGRLNHDISLAAAQLMDTFWHDLEGQEQHSPSEKEVLVKGQDSKADPGDPCLSYLPESRGLNHATLTESKDVGNHSSSAGSGSLEQTVQSALMPFSGIDGKDAVTLPSVSKDQLIENSSESSFKMLRYVADILGYSQGRGEIYKH